MTDEMEFETAAGALMHQLSMARKAGKDWWVALQVRQIEDTLWRDKKIAELTEALAMVRDANEDCKKDGLPEFLPWMPLAKVNRALERAALPADPEHVSFAAFLESKAK